MATRRLRSAHIGQEIPPTTVRLPPDVREALVKEADINGRTLSAEIVDRLQLTLHGPDMSQAQKAEMERLAHQYLKVSDAQRMLLTMFDAMPPDKQLALLTVLRR